MIFIATTVVFGTVSALLLCVCIVLLCMLRQSYDQLREVSEPILPPKILGMWVTEPDPDACWVVHHGE